MWCELVLCGAVRADGETETTKKTQWLIHVFPNSPCMTEHNWSKSKWNYIHSSIYKNIPSPLYVCYSRNYIWNRAEHLEVLLYSCFLCHHYNDFWSSLLVVCPAMWLPGIVICAHILQSPQYDFITVPHISFPVGACCPAASPRLQTIVLPQVLCSAINSKGTCGGHRPALKSLVWKVCGSHVTGFVTNLS